MPSLPQLEDVWATRDYPVLMAAAHLLEEHDLVQAQDIAAICDLPHRAVVVALTHLGHAHLIVEDSSTLDGRDNYVVGISPRGLEAVGQWPSPELGADRLEKVLDALADSAPLDSPKRARLIAVRDGLLEAGRDIMVDVAGAVISGRIPS